MSKPHQATRAQVRGTRVAELDDRAAQSGAERGELLCGPLGMVREAARSGGPAQEGGDQLRSGEQRHRGRADEEREPGGDRTERLARGDVDEAEADGGAEDQQRGHVDAVDEQQEGEQALGDLGAAHAAGPQHPRGDGRAAEPRRRKQPGGGGAGERDVV